MSEAWKKIPCKFTGKKPHSGGYINGYCPVRKRNVGAHVLACEKANGPKPTPKHTVEHKCSNRTCVEPSHLEWFTYSEQQKTRKRCTSRRKFSEHFVAEVLTDYHLSGDTQAEVAARHGIDHTQLSHWWNAYIGTPANCVRRKLSHLVIPAIDNVDPAKRRELAAAL